VTYAVLAAPDLGWDVKPCPDSRLAREMPQDPDSYPFAFAPLFGRVLRVIGVRPDSSWVRVHGDTLEVQFGRWRLITPLSNVCSAEVGGPYRAWKVLGARLSLADRGLTFGTNAASGACIRFRRPVPGLEPTGMLRHPGLTVTIAEPHLLVARLRRQPPEFPATTQPPAPPARPVR
jgi:hypothetical protein